MLALGAGRSPAAWAAMEPLPAGSTLCQPRARREWGDTHRHGWTGGWDAPLAIPGTKVWDPEMGAMAPLQGPPWRARQRWAAVPLDSTHPLGIPGSPLPCTHTHAAPLQVHSLHWVLPMDAGGKGGEGQPSLALTVRCPASTHHPTSPTLMPFRFPETPHNHCHVCHGIPSRSWRALGPLWEDWAPAKAVGRGDTPIPGTRSPLAHAPVTLPNCSRTQHPPYGQRDTFIPQTGRMGSAGRADPSQNGANSSGMPVGGGNGNSRLE